MNITIKKILILCALLCMMFTSVFADDHVTHLPGLQTPIHGQYAGYAPTKNGNRLFYWFVSTQNKKAPLILWSNGGPGYSSLYGFFEEIGPYTITPHLTLKKNKNSFSNFANLLIIDQPAGVGFSILSHLHSLKNRDDAITQYYQALYWFLEKHPAYQHNPIYLAGESYAGTYLPLLAKKIMLENKKHPLKIRIQGVILMSPWADPLSQQSMDAQYAYDHGIITQDEKTNINTLYARCQYLIHSKKYTEANTACEQIGVAIKRFSGLPDLANIAYLKNENDDALEHYLNQPTLKKAIHVSPASLFSAFSDNINCLFSSDIQRSVKNTYDFLLSQQIKLLIFSGLNDAKDTNFLGVKRFIQTLHWQKKGAYNKCAVKKVYDSKHLVIGYKKSGGGLTFMTVLNAGHMVPKDVPKVDGVVKKYVS